MPEKCNHQTVREHTVLYARETIYEPAEYLTQYICIECGAWLDKSDLDEATEIVK